MIERTLDELRAEVESSSLSETKKAELLQRILALKDLEKKASEQPLADLVAAIDGLEVSHPKITELVNRVATFLGNLGI